MDKLRAYLNALGTAEQFHLARRCGTTIGYLRKKLSAGGHIGLEIAVAIERETAGQVRVEDLRPDVDLAHIRAGRKRRSQATAVA